METRHTPWTAGKTDEPFTQGDAQAAFEADEPFGAVEFLLPIYTADGLRIGYVVCEPLELSRDRSLPLTAPGSLRGERETGWAFAALTA